MSLPDGSVLELNSGARATARLYEGKRVVQLLEGEIFFSVQHDPSRPFVVEAGESRIVVTGTRFNVRYDAQTTQVSVESGSVNVSNGPWWNRQSRALEKGQGLAVSDELGLGRCTCLTWTARWLGDAARSSLKIRLCSALLLRSTVIWIVP